MSGVLKRTSSGGVNIVRTFIDNNYIPTASDADLVVGYIYAEVEYLQQFAFLWEGEGCLWGNI